jgi:hypothetical protein
LTLANEINSSLKYETPLLFGDIESKINNLSSSIPNACSYLINTEMNLLKNLLDHQGECISTANKCSESQSEEILKELKISSNLIITQVKNSENTFYKKLSTSNTSLAKNLNTMQASLLTNDKTSFEKLNDIQKNLTELGFEFQNNKNFLIQMSNDLIVPNFKKISDDNTQISEQVSRSNTELVKN